MREFKETRKLRNALFLDGTGALNSLRLETGKQVMPEDNKHATGGVPTSGGTIVGYVSEFWNQLFVASAVASWFCLLSFEALAREQEITFRPSLF